MFESAALLSMDLEVPRSVYKDKYLEAFIDDIGLFLHQYQYRNKLTVNVELRCIDVPKSESFTSPFEFYNRQFKLSYTDELGLSHSLLK